MPIKRKNRKAGERLIIMLKNILLDLDGTIIDSKQCIFWVYKRLFAELGIIPPNEKELEKFIGPPVEEMLRRYVKNDEVRKYCDRFREIYKEVDLVSMNHPYDGIADVLSSLSKNYKLFVATTKYLSSLKRYWSFLS